MQTQIEGFSTSPGLIQALLKALVGIGKLIYNRRHRDEEIGSIPPREPEISEPGPPSREDAPMPISSPVPRELPSEITILIEDVRRIRAEVDDVKNGNLIEKIVGAKKLKADIEIAKADAKAAAELAKSTASDVKKELSGVIDGVKTDLSLLKGEEGRLGQVEAAIRMVKNGTHLKSVVESEFKKRDEKNGEWSKDDTTHGGIVGIGALLLGILQQLRSRKKVGV